MAQVSPGPLSLQNATREIVIVALQRGRAAVSQLKSEGADPELCLRAALSGASGYLLADESDISELLWQILKEATA